MHAKTPKRLGWAIQGHPASVGELTIYYGIPAAGPLVRILADFTTHVGAHGAIGVFLIGKGSDFDRAVPIGVRVRDD